MTLSMVLSHIFIQEVFRCISGEVANTHYLNTSQLVLSNHMILNNCSSWKLKLWTTFLHISVTSEEDTSEEIFKWHIHLIGQSQMKAQSLCPLCLDCKMEGRRDDSMVKSTGCSSRGSGVNAQHPCKTHTSI